MAGWTGKRGNVVFSKPESPSFLKRFKEKVGYKEDKGLSEKFAQMPKAEEEDLEDKDDELPQVVQLHPGDISEEEYKSMIGKDSSASEISENDKHNRDGKIVFRKPSDRKNQDPSNDLKMSTKKRNAQDDKNDTIKKLKKTKEESNRKLLSFDDEEDEEV